MRDAGCLIAFEGVEGAGKSTHLRFAANALRAQGMRVVETREPGGTPLGAELRRLLMEQPHAPAPWAELLLYLADRAEHLAAVIRPAIARGEIVLTDRFSASTIAYQGYARQLDLETVIHLDRVVRQDVAPVLTVLLDCPPAVGLARARGDDRFHREEVAFHERVRRGFLALASQEPDRYCVIDATGSNEHVQQQVVAAVMQCLRHR